VLPQKIAKVYQGLMNKKETRVCCSCHQEKSVEDFNRHIVRGDYQGNCRVCSSIHNKNYRHSKEGLLTFMYNKIKYRVSKQYTGIELHFSKAEFVKFAENSEHYSKLYNIWSLNNFLQAYVPTVDRKNSNGHYSLDNIQFLSQRDNSSKAAKTSVNPDISKYIGVCFDKSRPNQPYTASVHIHNQKKFLGRFTTPEAAAVAVNTKCLELGLPIKNKITED
jgi:hypothetical protein